MRGYPPHTPDGNRTVVLVDVGDSGNAAAACRTRRRLEEYCRRGWHVRPDDEADDLIAMPR